MLYIENKWNGANLMQKSHFFNKKLKFSAILRYTFGAISNFGSKGSTKSWKLSSDITSRPLKKSRMIKTFFRCNGANLRHLDIQKKIMILWKNQDFLLKKLIIRKIVTCLCVLNWRHYLKKALQWWLICTGALMWY